MKKMLIIGVLIVSSTLTCSLLVQAEKYPSADINGRSKVTVTIQESSTSSSESGSRESNTSDTESDTKESGTTESESYAKESKQNSSQTQATVDSKEKKNTFLPIMSENGQSKFGFYGICCLIVLLFGVAIQCEAKRRNNQIKE